MKLFNYLIIIIFICIFAYLHICILLPKAKADTFQQAKDILSTSVLGEKSVHTISFITVNAINAGGKIIIAFPNLMPGDTYQAGTSSASTFMLNNITDNYVKIFGLSGNGAFTGTYKYPTSSSDPIVSISFNLTGNTTIPANSQVTIILGCTSTNIANTACTTFSPIIYNPLTNLNLTNTWVIRIKTQDGSANTIDTTRVRVNTNQGINVIARIDQNFMMSIQGLPNTTLIQSNNSKCIDNTDITNSGINNTANTVNLGSIPINDISISGQEILIGTNGTSGYVLIATSSSSLINPDTGFSFKSSLLPKPITAGKNFFGIHPCGIDVDAVVWGTGKTYVPNLTISSKANKYAWPSVALAKAGKPSYYESLRLASHGNSRTLTQTTIEYAATTDNSVPSGNYKTSIMYTAMPIF